MVALSCCNNVFKPTLYLIIIYIIKSNAYVRLGRYLGSKWHRHPCNMAAKFGMFVDEDCDNLSSVKLTS